jgi:hypothetical protein
MSVKEATEQAAPVVAVNLKTVERSRSPWMDAWRRLRRNRAALVGGVVILFYIVV